MTGINRRLLGSFSAGDLSVLPQMAPRPVISKVRFLGLSLDPRPRSPNFGGGFFKGKGKRESFQHMRFSLVNDTPGRLTWNLKWWFGRWFFFFNWVIFRLHVDFSEGNIPSFFLGRGIDRRENSTAGILQFSQRPKRSPDPKRKF